MRTPLFCNTGILSFVISDIIEKGVLFYVGDCCDNERNSYDVFGLVYAYSAPAYMPACLYEMLAIIVIISKIVVCDLRDCWRYFL